MASSGAGGGGSAGPTLVAGLRNTLNTLIPGQVNLDIVLSGGITGGDTLTGGQSASDPLTLASTANATRGLINLRDPATYLAEDKTVAAGATPIIGFDTTAARTLTLSSATPAGNQVQAFRFNPTVVYAATSAAFSGFGFNIIPVLKNDTNPRTVHAFWTFQAAPTIRADTAVLTNDGFVGLIVNPTFDTVNGGTNNAAAAIGVNSSGVVNTGATVAAWTHFVAGDVSGTGSISGNLIGVDIAALTKGTVNIGLRNASTTVLTPTTKAITAVTDTIPITASVIRLNNTAGASVTLGSTVPVMADGVNGQTITLFNSSAQNVVLPDETVTAGSNLRLPGGVSLTLGQRDVVTLLFNSNLGDWIAVSNSNN
jgi:hypothetical protein